VVAMAEARGDLSQTKRSVSRWPLRGQLRGAAKTRGFISNSTNDLGGPRRIDGGTARFWSRPFFDAQRGRAESPSQAASRRACYSRVPRASMARAPPDEVAVGARPNRIEILDGADDHDVVEAVAITSEPRTPPSPRHRLPPISTLGRSGLFREAPRGMNRFRRSPRSFCRPPKPPPWPPAGTPGPGSRTGQASSFAARPRRAARAFIGVRTIPEPRQRAQPRPRPSPSPNAPRDPPPGCGSAVAGQPSVDLEPPPDAGPAPASIARWSAVPWPPEASASTRRGARGPPHARVTPSGQRRENRSRRPQSVRS